MYTKALLIYNLDYYSKLLEELLLLEQKNHCFEHTLDCYTRPKKRIFNTLQCECNQRFHKEALLALQHLLD